MGDPAARIARYRQLYDDAATWRRTMQHLSELVRPLREEIGRTLVDGARRSRNLYDSTGIVSNNNLGGHIYGSASNPADKWFSFETEDPDFNKWPKAKSALEAYSRRTLSTYGPSYSAFYAQTFPLYLDVTGLGTGYFYQSLRPDHSGFIDKCVPLSEAEFAVDDEGNANEFYRCFSMTLVEADKLARDNGGALSEKAQKKLAEKPLDKIEILHAVYPNEDYQPGYLGPAGKAFASCYIEMAEKHEISAGGFEEFPFYVPRWEVGAGERKGRGMAEIAEADILSLQVMQKANLQAGEWQANPLMGAPNDANLNVARMRPGNIIFGAVNLRGEELVKALHKNSGSPFSLEMANQLRQAIKDAFESTVLSIVGPNRTGLAPEEVLEQRDQRFRRMAPYQGNLTSGFLQPHVARRFRLLTRAGSFRDIKPPKELAGRPLHINFTSPMALAQAAARASSAVRGANALLPVIEIDPSARDRFNGDAYTQVIFKGFGIPEVLNDDDVTAQNRQARQQQEQAAQRAAMAEQVAGAAQKGAGAVASLRQPQPGA